MAKRPQQVSAPEGPPVGAAKGDWMKLVPELAGWVCDGAYDDGGAKGDSELLLRRRGFLIQAQLRIEDGGLVMRAVGDTPTDALVALELCLTSAVAPWERDQYPLGAHKQKKKK